jgi:hypothetical protein
MNIEEYLDGEEVENFKSVLTAMLVESTEMDLDTICSLVFNEGNSITWH